MSGVSKGYPRKASVSYRQYILVGVDKTNAALSPRSPKYLQLERFCVGMLIFYSDVYIYRLRSTYTKANDTSVRVEVLRDVTNKKTRQFPAAVFELSALKTFVRSFVQDDMILCMYDMSTYNKLSAQDLAGQERTSEERSDFFFLPVVTPAARYALRSRTHKQYVGAVRVTIPTVYTTRVIKDNTRGDKIPHRVIR